MNAPLKVAGETMLKIFDISPEIFLAIVVVISAILVIFHEKFWIFVVFLLYYACFAGVLILLGSLLPTVIQWILIAFGAFCIFKYATAK